MQAEVQFAIDSDLQNGQNFRGVVLLYDVIREEEVKVCDDSKPFNCHIELLVLDQLNSLIEEHLLEGLSDLPSL